jgi:hypothetical protein
MEFVQIYIRHGKPALSVFCMLILTGVCPGYGQNAGIEVIVSEGEGAINNVRTHTGHDPVVELHDKSGAPVVGAAVTFQLPVNGPSGRFADAQTSLVAQTDEHGQAIGRGLRPNALSGPFEIRVTASFQGQTANAIINQTNAAPAEAKSNKKYWIIALVAGAGAGGAFAATHSKSSTAAATTPTGGIVAGSPSFGPPH